MFFVIHDGHGRPTVSTLDGDEPLVSAEEAAEELRSQGRLLAGPMGRQEAEDCARKAWASEEMQALRDGTHWSYGNVSNDTMKHEFTPTTKRGRLAVKIADMAGVCLASWAAETDAAKGMGRRELIALFEVRCGPKRPTFYWRTTRLAMEGQPETVAHELMTAAKLDDLIHRMPEHKRIVREARKAMKDRDFAKMQAITERLEEDRAR